MMPADMKKTRALLLIAGIILALNILVQPFLLRLDFTEGGQYTLGKATKNILKNLEDQITVTAYFSGGLPPDIGKVKRDFQDLLVEFSAASKGKLDFVFVEPNSDEQKQEAANLGIQPLTINVREKDQVKQQQAFLGAVIRSKDNMEVIPFVEPGASMEYNLASSIKKLSAREKPSVAFLSGHGEPSLNELSEAVQALNRLYDVTTIDLNNTPEIPDSIKVAVMLAPKQPLPAEHFDAMDRYLAKGGQLITGINRVEVDMQTAMASALPTGLEAWLLAKGLEVDTSLVIDVQCGAVSVPQNLGMIQFNTQVKFPYLPLVNAFTDHPAVRGLDQVLFPYVSPLRFVGDPKGPIKFEPLVFSSAKTGVQKTPLTLQVAEKKWTESDFPLQGMILGGILSGRLAGENDTRMLVFGDGDFPISGQQGRAMSPDNVNLLVNAVDWMGDDSGLMELRTKTVGSRPLHAEYLLEESHSKRQTIKWLNVGLPVMLTILTGIYFQQRQSAIRRQRQEENFE